MPRLCQVSFNFWFISNPIKSPHMSSHHWPNALTIHQKVKAKNPNLKDVRLAMHKQSFMMLKPGKEGWKP